MNEPRDIGRLTRRSLMTGGIAALAGGAAWEWIRTRRPEGGVPWPLRIGLNVDQQLSEDYSSPTRLARTFPPEAAEPARPNGNIGLDDPPDPNWRLQFADQELRIEDIQALPKIVITAEFKCIEGWSRISTWAGARFSDFVAKYYNDDLTPDQHVAMETPDGEYYVGLELAAAMHPQTLLAYELNGQPLPAGHGAPLRLLVPVKYGIKNLKRIGKIEFSLSRPKDYWAEQGYDWYAGF